MDEFEVIDWKGRQIYFKPGWQDQVKWISSQLQVARLSNRCQGRHGAGGAQKSGGRRGHPTIYLAEKDVRVIVKEYVRGGWISFLGNLHLHRRCLTNEIEAIKRSKQEGIKTYEIIGFICEKVAFIFLRFKAITVEIPDAINLYDFLRSRPEINLLIANLAQEIKRLHRAGILHGDLNLRNILIGSNRDIYFVDFDHARIMDKANWRDSLGDIERLNRSCEKIASRFITKADKIVFLKAYLDNDIPMRYAISKCKRWLWWHKLLWRLT